MEFTQAAKLAKKGKRIRRKGWKGYWYLRPINVLTSEWVIHTAKGDELTSNFTQETINNTLAKDWEEVN